MAVTLACCVLLLPSVLAQTRAAPAADAECLACHSQSGLKSDAGKSLYVDPAKRKGGVHAILRCTSCHSDIREYPHPKQIHEVDCASCHADEAAAVSTSVHGALGEDQCEACHGTAHDARSAASAVPRACETCHKEAVHDFLQSAHGAAIKTGDPDGPNCESCHGAVHQIPAMEDAGSPVAKRNLPDTCAACHSNPAFLAKYQIPFAHPVEAFRLSVHGRALAAGNARAPSCSDCHSSHKILPGSNARSATNHWNISETCGACHGEIKAVYEQSVHGVAMRADAPDAPVCTDCHGEHSILAPGDPQSSVSPARVSVVTCGRCHADERIEARYNLPADRVPTFADSYHGLASRAGSQTVANCASCHGVHNIFPSSDPRSTVNAANLARTCGACHPGAGQSFAIGAVHIGASARDENGAVKWIRRAYGLLIPATLIFMLFHRGIDFIKKTRALRERIPEQTSELMNRHFRIAHWMVVASFPVLVVTGFALKSPEAWWARPILIEESRFGFRGVLHRAAAVVLLASVGYHIVTLLLNRRDRAVAASLVPRSGDVQSLRQTILYNLGLVSEPPVRSGNVGYVEKFEYWAFAWGTAVMTATGFLLWFHNFALRHFPKWVEDASTALHYYEAILATASILIWHMYTVVFDPEIYPMDTSWLTGKKRVHPHADAPSKLAPESPTGNTTDPTTGTAGSPKA